MILFGIPQTANSMDDQLFQVTDNDTQEVASYNGSKAFYRDQKAAKGVRDLLNEMVGYQRFRVSRGPDHPKNQQP